MYNRKVMAGTSPTSELGLGVKRRRGGVYGGNWGSHRESYGFDKISAFGQEEKDKNDKHQFLVHSTVRSPNRQKTVFKKGMATVSNFKANSPDRKRTPSLNFSSPPMLNSNPFQSPAEESEVSDQSGYRKFLKLKTIQSGKPLKFPLIEEQHSRLENPSPSEKMIQSYSEIAIEPIEFQVSHPPINFPLEKADEMEYQHREPWHNQQ